MIRLTTLFLALAAVLMVALGATGPTSSTDELPYGKDTICALKVKNLEKSMNWYRDVLALDVHLSLPELGWCELTTPVEGSFLGLGAVHEGEEFEANGAASFSFAVTDIEAMRRHLVAKKVKVGEIVDIPETVRLLEFSDPDGNRLMLHQAAR